MSQLNLRQDDLCDLYQNRFFFQRRLYQRERERERERERKREKERESEREREREACLSMKIVHPWPRLIKISGPHPRNQIHLIENEKEINFSLEDT